MKSLIRAGIAGICLIAPAICSPAICGASTINFETAGSQYNLLFDPQGCNPSQLPPTGFYRSYECRIGAKPQPVVCVTKPVIPHLPPSNTPENNPPANNPPVNTPANNPPVITTPPTGGSTVDTPVLPTEPVVPPPCETAAVPLPPAPQIAGIGLLATIAICSLRSRRYAGA
jgi:hypothetical protein